MIKINNPHDKFFKSCMANTQVAKSFLESHLSKEVLSKINLDTLEVVNESFIDEDLQELLTDMLFTAKCGDQVCYIYMLVEHLKKPERLVPFRIWQYMFRIMSNHIDKKGHKRLPVVVPLIFYNGEKIYPYSTDFFDCFEDVNFAKEILLQPIRLIDLNRISNQEIRQHQWASVMEMAMKHEHAVRLAKVLSEMAVELKIIDDMGGEEYIMNAVVYLVK